MNRPVYIIDTTLRDGEQTPNVAFSIDEKLAIADLLDQLGVDEIEAGTPAIGHQEQQAIRAIAKAGFKFKTSSWCRAKAMDIVQAARLGTQSINISLPVSDIQMETLGKNRGWVLDQIGEIVSIARGLFPHVTLGAQDASRADLDFLLEYIGRANDAGADRIRLADTVGILDPMETHEFVSKVKSNFTDLKIEFHGHNDYGMGTANAIVSIKAGADCISATVNGLGERAGNSALEEIIAYLSTKHGDKRFNTKVIGNLTRLVSELSNTPIPKQKAITGENAFRHESGIHTSAILKNVKSYQILNPSDYGLNETQISFGKHSGRASIIEFFKTKGIRLNQLDTEKILIKIKELSFGKAELEEDQLMQIYRELNIAV